MKKQNLIIALCALCLLVTTGCSNKVEKNENNLNKENTIKETANDWKNSALEYEVASSVYNSLSKDYIISKIVSMSTNDSFKNNKFVIKFNEELSKTSFDNLTDKQKDFFIAYTISRMTNLPDVKIEKVWSINYNGEEKNINSCKGNGNRGFFVLGKSNQIDYLLIIRFGYASTVDPITKEKNYNVVHKYINLSENNLDEYFKEKYNSKLEEKDGTLSCYFCQEPFDYDKEQVSKYVYEDSNKYINLVDTNSEFWKFLNEYGALYKKIQDEVTDIYNSNENKNKSIPKVGMTAEEVKKTSWGIPNKINKDTYSWGTTEQWVYNDYGYVYFKNGVVTSVSER